MPDEHGANILKLWEDLELALLESGNQVAAQSVADLHIACALGFLPVPGLTLLADKLRTTLCAKGDRRSRLVVMESSGGTNRMLATRRRERRR